MEYECTKCRNTEHLPGSNFCKICGEKIEVRKEGEVTIEAIVKQVSVIQRERKFFLAELKGRDQYDSISEDIKAALLKHGLSPEFSCDLLNHLGRTYRLEQTHRRHSM